MNLIDPSGLMSEHDDIGDGVSDFIDSLGCMGRSHECNQLDSRNGNSNAFQNRRTNRGGQGQGERRKTSSPNGTPDPDKKFKPGAKPGTRVSTDANGKTKVHPWPNDPRTGGDGTGVRRGSKIPQAPKPKPPKPARVRTPGGVGIIVVVELLIVIFEPFFE